jgi:hypothetical protein
MAQGNSGNAKAQIKRAKQQKGQVGSLVSFPTKEIPHSILMVFKKYEYKTVEEGYSLLRSNIQRGNRSAGIELSGQYAIQLPFPLGLVDATGLRINSFERDALTESITAAASDFMSGRQGQNLGQALGAATEAASASLQNLGINASEALKGFSESPTSLSDVGQKMMDMAGGVFRQAGQADLQKLGSAAAYLLRSKLPGDIAKQIDAVLGQSINPRETLAFEGVNMKAHSFSWELYPSNRADSDAIRNIVRTLKVNALPTATDLGNPEGFGIAKAFLEYPSTVDVYLLGVNQDHFPLYKTAMVNDFTIDYGLSETAMLKGGKPAAVSLSMSITELGIHTANDYFFPEDQANVTEEQPDMGMTDYDPGIDTTGVA